MGYRAHGPSLCGVCWGWQELSWPDLSPGCLGLGLSLGSCSQGAEGTFPCRQSLAVAGPIWGWCWLTWVILCSSCCAFLLSQGQCGGAGAGAALEPWAHQRLLSPAQSTCNNVFVTGGRQQKATGSHFSRCLYLVANAPFTPSASSFPSTERLNPVFSL